jgi:hypothetical protein
MLFQSVCCAVIPAIGLITEAYPAREIRKFDFEVDYNDSLVSQCRRIISNTETCDRGSLHERVPIYLPTDALTQSVSWLAVKVA